MCLNVRWRSGVACNVLGIAEGGEIEAEKFRFCTEASQNEFFELNLKIKNE